MNWKYIGIFLFVLWLLLTTTKFSNLSNQSYFSYKRAYFGRLEWYKNFRNWLLIAALLLIEIFAPLKTIFLMFFLAALLFMCLCFRNLKHRVGLPSVSLWLFLGNMILVALSGTVIFAL
ncbi:hypothetical protein LFYK43_14580 [Ligilactobacillus salitolerans]|uniref:Uncharacterized protein n=1 Tax=Ligilactobacillus salitolerans TaxID=1808352 RepID=A0A401ITZ4_9LACO|nr:hypothetical protein [Ligilactobacillus salitolerans]GBG94999.1 hypothetical protein LFYK43_14580 [Ligilactobacillus salitolerans]